MSFIDRFKNNASKFASNILNAGRIGVHDATWCEDKEGTLHDIVGEGYGLMPEQWNLEIPNQMADFIMYVTKNTGLFAGDDFYPLAKICGQMAMSHVGSWDPYMVFEYSDVTYSHMWREKTFRIYDYSNKEGVVADPQKLEVFIMEPGRDESWFNEALNSFPSFQLFRHGSMLDDFIFGYGGEEMTHYIDEQPGLKRFLWACYEDDDIYNAVERLQETGKLVITEDQSDYQILVSTYVEVMVTAALMWFLGPLGKVWRGMNHEVFHTVYNYNMCIVYDHCIYTPQDCEILDIDPAACHLCGLNAYCVELVGGFEGTAVNVCHACQSAGRPLAHGATCGTRFCKHVECPYNALHGSGRYAYIDLMREKGNLSRMVPQTPAIGHNSDRRRRMIGQG